MTTGWDGAGYQRRFDQLAATGADVHGEANLVRWLLSARACASRVAVLDAGCGTGRVAIELATRRADGSEVDVVGVDVPGVDVVGVDVDPSMLATARRLRPDLTWVHADLGGLQLDRTFDVVVMAGNVLLFTPAGTQAGVVAACARHVAAGGLLVAGFELGRGYELEDYDSHCQAAGLALADRWATWDRRLWDPASSYAVSAHRHNCP